LSQSSTGKNPAAILAASGARPSNAALSFPNNPGGTISSFINGLLPLTPASVQAEPGKKSLNSTCSEYLAIQTGLFFALYK
jgi:hypothetical protein